MKFFPKFTHLKLICATTATFATLGFLIASPATAVRFKINFCGDFNNDDIDGEVRPGSFIEIDSDVEENSGLVDANITTFVRGEADLTYSFEDLIGSGRNTLSIPNYNEDPIETESGYWRFSRPSSSSNSLNNEFFAVIPENIIDDAVNTSENALEVQLNDNAEIRIVGGSQRFSGKEKDPRVPEPLTILGSVTALGIGAALKRKHSRKQKKVAQAD